MKTQFSTPNPTDLAVTQSPASQQALGFESQIMPVARPSARTAFGTTPMRSASSTQVQLLKAERRLHEAKICSGDCIPGTALTMGAKDEVFQLVQLTSLKGGGCLSQKTKATPLKIAIPYRALTHIVCAPGRIGQVKATTGFRSIEDWLIQSFEQVKKSEKPWTYHVCPETQRQIISVFEDEDQRGQNKASRFVLTSSNPAKLITAYPVFTMQHWNKFASSLKGAPLELKASFGLDQLSSRLRAKAQLIIDNIQPAEVRMSQPGLLLPQDEVAQMNRTPLLNKAQTPVEIEVESPSDEVAEISTEEIKRQAKLDRSAVLEDNVIEELGYFEADKDNYEVYLNDAQSTLRQALQLIDPASPHLDDFGHQTFTANQAIKFHQATELAGIHDQFSILMAKPLELEEQRQKLLSAIQVFEKSIKKLPVGDRPLQRESLVSLKKMLDFLDQQLVVLKQKSSLLLTAWLINTVPIIDKLKNVAANLCVILSVGQDVFSRASSNNFVGFPEYHDFKSSQLTVNLMKSLLNGFDAGLLCKDFNNQSVQKQLDYIEMPDLDESVRVKALGDLSEGLFNVAQEVSLNFLRSLYNNIKPIIEFTQQQLQTSFDGQESKNEEVLKILPVKISHKKCEKIFNSLGDLESFFGQKSVRKDSFRLKKAYLK